MTVDGLIIGSMCLPLKERMFVFELGFSNTHLMRTERIVTSWTNPTWHIGSHTFEEEQMAFVPEAHFFRRYLLFTSLLLDYPFLGEYVVIFSSS